MTAISTIRHQPIFDPSEYGDIPLHVIGVGATGSHLVMSLVELGFKNITFYDDDKIEGHNLANQAYNANQVGMYKVTALNQLIKAKLGGMPENIKGRKRRITAESRGFDYGIVFLLTDTMESRKEIGQILDTSVYVIETRMASTHGNVLGFNPLIELTEWHKTLSNDEDTEVSSCGASISVGPTAKIIANLAVWHLINYLTCKEATEKQTNIFLKPLAIHNGDFEYVQEEQTSTNAEQVPATPEWDTVQVRDISELRGEYFYYDDPDPQTIPI